MKIVIVIDPAMHTVEAAIHDAKSPGGYYRRLLLFSGSVHEWPKVMKLIEERGNEAIQRIIEGSRPPYAILNEQAKRK